MPYLCNFIKERKELCKIQYNAQIYFPQSWFSILLFIRASYIIFFCLFLRLSRRDIFVISKTLAKISMTIAKIKCTAHRTYSVHMIVHHVNLQRLLFASLPVRQTCWFSKPRLSISFAVCFFAKVFIALSKAAGLSVIFYIMYTTAMHFRM